MTSRPWPPPGRHRDDRLVFLAALPTLQKWAHPWWKAPFAALGRQVHHSRGVPDDPRALPPAGRLARYALACERVRPRLSDEEVQRVRETGGLPDWFLPAVRREARRRR